MKRVLFHFIYACIFFTALYPVVYVASSFGVFGEAEFGYFEDYNIARHAVKNSRDVTLLDKGMFHTDFGLRLFSLCLSTKSGWQVELHFWNGMGVREACYHFKGLLVDSPVRGTQVYSTELLDKLLRDKNLHLRSVKDMLCYFDELAPVLQANYDNEAIPLLEGNRYYKGYLVISNVPWNTKAEEATIQERAPLEPTHLTGTGPDGKPQYGYSYQSVSTNNAGNIVSTEHRQASSYPEQLGEGISLEMVKIPGGKFQMGLTDSEAERLVAYYRGIYRNEVNLAAELGREKPQHQVTVPGFYMGKLEVTQAQWRAVAGLPKVEIELDPDPSLYKGDDLPVEQVSWEEAMEFCARLSRFSGREYRLPTEAEWEYACRAGTTTPFHFGETVTTSLANFDGEHSFGKSWGFDKGEMTPVGYFRVANRFGLYDMHGNVAEWCLDRFHQNYEGAPADGSAWLVSGDEDKRVVRGGAWRGWAASCRSAARWDYYREKRKDSAVGFRVVSMEKQ